MKETESKKTFYLTTPIYYPSGSMHIGHAYTTVAADTTIRYKKMRGYETYFLTGTDEHGLKIQRRAKEAGCEPQQFVDGIVTDIKKLWQALDIQYDDFIRTTEPRHQKVAQAIFQKIYDQGDIYKAEYEGWYCTPCETFFTQRQLAEGNACPDCGRPVELTKEESYFFKMSKYADRWLQFIKENPDFIQPESRRNEMVSFVKQGLEDLCVSRTTFEWGIKVPFDQKHVIYVWFDALINYISALGYDFNNPGEKYKKFWPADVHLMGKDIIRFHAIIWPIMLMALGLPLPKQVLGHGWVILDSGKMSKSKGNVVDPLVLIEKYGVDAIRYFLLREMGYGQDSLYSEAALVNRINIDLANDYGNLLSRTTAMIEKFCGGLVGAPGVGTEHDAELVALAKKTPAEYAIYMDKLDFQNALAAVWRLINQANKYIDAAEPWALNKARQTEKLQTVLYNLAEVLRISTILISPFMPNVPAKVWQQLGISNRQELFTWSAVQNWGAFPPGVRVTKNDALFPRLDWQAIEAAGAQKEAEKAAEAAKEAEVAFAPFLPQIDIDQFGTIDLRVAEVLACEKVPKADKLLQLQVKVGTEERTIVSGIAQYYTPEEMIGKKVVLVANLKPAKLRGIESHGMLLAASHGGKLEVVEIKDIEPGGRVK